MLFVLEVSSITDMIRRKTSGGILSVKADPYACALYLHVAGNIISSAWAYGAGFVPNVYQLYRTMYTLAKSTMCTALGTYIPHSLDIYTPHFL